MAFFTGRGGFGVQFCRWRQCLSASSHSLTLLGGREAHGDVSDLRRAASIEKVGGMGLRVPASLQDDTKNGIDAFWSREGGRTLA